MKRTSNEPDRAKFQGTCRRGQRPRVPSGTMHITQLMLELYHAGTASAKERKTVEAALSFDSEVRSRYEALQRSDIELRRRYSLDRPNVPVSGIKRVSHNRRLLLRLGAAAAAVLCILITLFIFFGRQNSSSGIEIASAHDTERRETAETELKTEPLVPVTEDIDISAEETEMAANPPEETEIKTERRIYTAEQRRGSNNQVESINPVDENAGVLVAAIPNPQPGITLRGGSAAPEQPAAAEQTNISIPPGLTLIFDIMFADRQLTNVTIPNRITSIGSNAFAGNPLTSVTIGANVTIADNAFPGNFAGAYTGFGKAAGTYTRPDTYSNVWIKQ